MSNYLYDPKYGKAPATIEGLTREHSAYREDMAYELSEGNGSLPDWKVVAYIDQKYAF